MRRRPVILSVDDDAVIHDTYATIFEAHYECLRAQDGLTALATLEAQAVDVMLLDLRMPGMGGLAVLDRARLISPETKVIVVSVVDQSRPAIDAMRLGAVEYVTKPFDADALSLVVRHSLTKRSATWSHDREAPPASAPYVLVAGGDVGFRAGLAVALRTRCYVDVVPTVAAALDELRQGPPELLIVNPSGEDPGEIKAVHSLDAALATRPLLAVGSLLEPVALGDDPAGPRIRRVFDPPLDYHALLRETETCLATRLGLPPTRRFGAAVSQFVGQVSGEYAQTNIEELAHAVGVSTGHLLRVLHEEMSMTPKDYLTRVRVEVAKYLLKETNLRIETIAERVGLHDGPHLSRVFRQSVGTNPRTFRQS